MAPDPQPALLGEVEDRDQDFEALRAPRIRRQERGAEPDAVGAQARAVANPWRTNRNRADAGHDLAFGQVAVAHQPSAAFFGARLGVAIKKPGNLRLDRPRQQGPGAAAQHLGQRIGKRRWLGKLQNGIVTHGVSLLRWRSGGSITPTIRRLNPSPRHQLLAIALADLHWNGRVEGSPCRRSSEEWTRWRGQVLRRKNVGRGCHTSFRAQA